MPMEQLAKLLDERSAKVPDAVERIEKWQDDVAALCAVVEASLEPLRAAGRVLIDHSIDETTEEHLGTYKTKGLGLRFRDVPGKVKLRAKSALVVGVRLPNGAWTTGVQGRVDLSYGAVRVPVVRVGSEPTEWQIGIDDELEDLSEPKLERALRNLLGL